MNMVPERLLRGGKSAAEQLAATIAEVEQAADLEPCSLTEQFIEILTSDEQIEEMLRYGSILKDPKASISRVRDLKARWTRDSKDNESTSHHNRRTGPNLAPHQ